MISYTTHLLYSGVPTYVHNTIEKFVGLVHAAYILVLTLLYEISKESEK